MDETPNRERRLPSLPPVAIFALVILLIGGSVLLWQRERRAYERERRAAAEIERLGGSIGYRDSGPGLLEEWISVWFGRNLRSAVEVFSADCAEMTGEVSQHLAGLTNLEVLWLHSTPVTDSGLKQIAGLTNLQSLNLSSTRITDEGLKHIASLTGLQQLFLGSTQVTDAGLKHLAGLTNLRNLDLYSTQITDAGLRHLAELTGLRQVHAKSTRVTPEGARELQMALPNCTIIYDSKQPAQ
jgi:Leucine-rich repeat (LRR) protein